ncbi:hypothetical protein EIQ07_17275 [Xanthomonas campestris pv. campestris]
MEPVDGCGVQRWAAREGGERKRDALRFGNRESGSGKREAGSGKREAGFGKRDSGIGSRESGVGSRESGSGKRESLEHASRG